jgi:hypothetical protein
MGFRNKKIMKTALASARLPTRAAFTQLFLLPVFHSSPLNFLPNCINNDAVYQLFQPIPDYFEYNPASGQ